MEKGRCFKVVLNQITMSCRKVFIRHLRIFVSVGMANERKEIRRSRSPRRTGEFRDDRPLFNNNNAFTLIELLVVVLIIGILAAVALPQYTKAVERSRATQAVTLLKSLYQAAQEYQLANGEWFKKFDELSVDIPWTGTVKWRDHSIMKDTRSNEYWSLQNYAGESNPIYRPSISIGRINGKYAGAGLMISEKGELYCAERLSEGITFDGEPGDYCVKVMRCTGTLSNASAVRSWPCPM
ncbi:type IV pilin protein [Candidatus Avelusimicrobium caledoniensis]|uniref:type IV pilin protein n=1 Tax=Candidatus Avelusimicrobium caledoniensis TaxID=3416220 RepID=UPI003D0F7053